MPSRPLPNLLLQAFFALGEDGWNDENDSNMLKLSVLTQANVSAKVAVEPGAPAAGTVIVLDETHATHPNAVAVYDAGAWVYFTPNEGWLLYDRTTNAYLTFDGAAWVALATGGGGADKRELAGFAEASPTASEVLFRANSARAWTLPANMVGSVCAVAVNPTATYVLSVRKNGVECGTISISTVGVATFATTGGAPVAFAIGDRLSVVGAAVADATVAGISWSILGDL